MSNINIVLFQPEIAGNTANIIRTCVGLNATLHLIKPYGFDLSLSEKVFKRGSTNYAQIVKLIEHESFEEFEKIYNPKDFYFLTRYANKSYDQINISEHKESIFYIFGKESSGIDKEILEKYLNQTFRIPMDKKMRSLNLSNCAMLVAYDGARQQNFSGLSFEECQKPDYLTKGEQ